MNDEEVFFSRFCHNIKAWSSSSPPRHLAHIQSVYIIAKVLHNSHNINQQTARVIVIALTSPRHKLLIV
jgi:hypothetical protein